jgi:hypothetical protein
MPGCTSAAAPHVSAVAILLTSRWPNDYPVSIKNRLMRCGVKDWPLGEDDLADFPRLHAYNALEGIFPD